MSSLTAEISASVEERMMERMRPPFEETSELPKRTR